jgi:hypothetical protein
MSATILKILMEYLNKNGQKVKISNPDNPPYYISNKQGLFIEIEEDNILISRLEHKTIIIPLADPHCFEKLLECIKRT